MKIDLLFLSCNRLYYTRHSMPALLADPSEEFSLTIWDNGSTDGSREFLESIEDPRIVEKVFSPTNIGSYRAINMALEKSTADLVGLVADDLLVTPGWTKILGAAHAEVREFGRLSCWHFAPDSFDYGRAGHKIQTFGRHRVLRHPWTNGCGLAKLSAVRAAGAMRPAEGESAYWRRMALKGYVVGYYCPPVPVEHMDYPWSAYFAYTDRFEQWVRVSGTARSHGFKSLDDVRQWHQVVLQDILDGPWEVKHYVGWRRRVRRVKARVRRLLAR